MIRTVYGLQARGNSRNGWAFNMWSKNVYEDEEEAKKAKPQFIEKCCDRSQFDCAVMEGLKITTVLLNLVEKC